MNLAAGRDFVEGVGPGAFTRSMGQPSYARGMKYKLAVFDIDGTLIGPREAASEGSNSASVPESAAVAIRSLVHRGIAVAIGTARPYSASLGPFMELEIQGEAIVSSGADVRRADGSIVVQEPFDAETATFLAELCDRAAWSPTVATVDGMIMRLDRPPDWIDRAPKGMRVVKSLAENVPRGMLSIVTGADRDGAFAAELRKHSKLSVEEASTRDGGVLVTVTRAGVDKGSGLVALCRSLNISPDEAVAFGDADVDVPMFEAAGLGVAMGNASERAKTQADIVTNGVLEDGLANAVQEIWGV